MVLIGALKVTTDPEIHSRPFVCDKCGRVIKDGETETLLGEHLAQFDSDGKVINPDEPFGKTTHLCEKCLDEIGVKINVDRYGKLATIDA